MLYFYEASVTFHFLGFFLSMVSLFFHCVTVKTLFMFIFLIPHQKLRCASSMKLLPSVLRKLRGCCQNVSKKGSRKNNDDKAENISHFH